MIVPSSSTFCHRTSSTSLHRTPPPATAPLPLPLPTDPPPLEPTPTPAPAPPLLRPAPTPLLAGIEVDLCAPVPLPPIPTLPPLIAPLPPSPPTLPRLFGVPTVVNIVVSLTTVPSPSPNVSSATFCVCIAIFLFQLSKSGCSAQSTTKAFISSPYKKAAKFSVNRESESCMIWRCRRFVSRSARESVSSAKEGSKISSG